MIVGLFISICFTELNHRIDTEPPPVKQVLYIFTEPVTERDPEDGLYFNHYKYQPRAHQRIPKNFVSSVDKKDHFIYCLPVG